MAVIDTLLFIEIIRTERVDELRVHEIDGLQIGYYVGPSGKKISIILSDECLNIKLAKKYLEQLGLSDLISRLFPNQPEEFDVTPDEFGARLYPHLTKLKGKTFYFTGVLPTLTPEKAKKLVESNGGKLCDCISPSLNYLVAGGDAEGEINVAKDFSINVLSEVDFLGMII